MSRAHPAPATYRSERLIAFTDAVMAVVITLLVLDLKLPEGVGDEDLYAAIPNLSRALWCYVLSFVVIGILWMARHRQFHSILRVDGVMLWLNLLFLMSVALIPFVTSVLSDHATPLPTMLYAGVLTASCTTTAAMWWYAGPTPGLMAPDVTITDRRAGGHHPAGWSPACSPSPSASPTLLAPRAMDLAAGRHRGTRGRPPIPSVMASLP
jgi:uncharacterized membrane protein